MKTLAILAQKGGSGKTTLTVHLAVCAVEQGYSTAILDIDPQGSAAIWNEIREDERKIETAKADAQQLAGYLDMARQAKVDLAVIDTAPHSNHEAAIVAQLSDFILIPCRPALFDLQAVRSAVEIAQSARKPFAVVINSAPRGKITDEARASLEGGGVPVFRQVMHQRAAYSHAVIDGRAVHEFEPGGKAAQEIDGLYAEISRELGLTRKRRKAA